ncbi:DNA-binding transcriptional MocR family regulator [Tenggerimyces flavus]|nr:DNA-binding transcriptional MocR family regulator [Tenggerimyces flavus]
MENAVRTGDLAPGAQLPPVRTLAATLGVSPGTVATAYQALRQRGVVSTDGRRGTRVLAKPATVARSQLRLPVPPGARDLSAGNPDPAFLPAFGPRLRRLDPEKVLYGAPSTVPELAALARERLAADDVPADHLTVTSGCLDGIERSLAAHLRPGDAVAVEDPGWHGVLDLLAAMNLRAVPCPVDPDGLEPDGLAIALHRGAKAVVVTSRAQNPTGASLPRGRAAELREVLDDFPDVLVVDDDHAGELASEPLHSLAASTDSWAVIRSLSKPFGPDLRCAVLAGDAETVSRVEGRQWLGARWVSTVLQSLVVALWTDPEVTSLVDQARRTYDARRSALLGALAARGIEAHGTSGLNVWIPVSDETSAAVRLLEAGWVVAPGQIFRIASRPGLRVTVTTLEESEAPTLAAAIAAALAPGGRSSLV